MGPGEPRGERIHYFYKITNKNIEMSNAYLFCNKLSTFTHGVKLSIFTHCVKLSVFTHGVKLSGVKLSAVSNCSVSNCPVPNCPRCQIVRGVKLSWCQIVTQPKLLKIGRKRKRKVNVFQSGQKKVAKNREEAESNREGNGGEYSASVSSLLGNNLGAAHCGCVTYSKLLH